MQSNALGLQDLQSLLKIIQSQHVLPLRITLFLDALDEYEGPPEVIADFLQRAAASMDNLLTIFKVFFSSRPLQFFLDKFDQVSGFDISQYTKEDIDIVIRSKMLANPRMYHIMRDQDSAQLQLAVEFAQEVSARALGIFLWVDLVLEELMEEFTAGETMMGLKKKLVYLPSRLEDFYQHTLERIPGRYHNDTKLIFEIIGSARRPIQLHDLYEVCRCSKIPTLKGCTSCTAPENRHDSDSLQRWLRTRTAGLVQLSPFVCENPDSINSRINSALARCHTFTRNLFMRFNFYIIKSRHSP